MINRIYSIFGGRDSDDAVEYRIFHTVTQQGSFARAAQILHLTPSAISHAVSSMEESCGFFALCPRARAAFPFTRSGEALPVIRQVLSLPTRR